MKTLILSNKFKILFSFLLSNIVFAQEVESKKIKMLEEELVSRKFLLLPHKGNFLIPLSYNNNPNNKAFDDLFGVNKVKERGKYNRYLEAEFQVSFLVLWSEKFFDSKYSGFMGYTTHSWWQIYNEEWSRPFRETNYELELFLKKTQNTPISFLGGKLYSHAFGIVHQSNGQVQELSRSWNRYFGSIELLYDAILLKLTAWHITRGTITSEDNPDIYKYRGYGSLSLTYKYDDVILSYTLTPGTLKTGHELSLQGPFQEGLNYYLKFNYGYGESLIDYNHENRRIGLGIILENPYVSKL